MFPSGHCWTDNGVGEFADASGPFIVNGDRSYRITTNSLGDESIATSPALDPVDLTRSHVSVHAQVSFSNRLQAVKPVFFYVAGIYAVPTQRKATITLAFDWPATTSPTASMTLNPKKR